MSERNQNCNARTAITKCLFKAPSLPHLLVFGAYRSPHSRRADAITASSPLLDPHATSLEGTPSMPPLPTSLDRSPSLSSAAAAALAPMRDQVCKLRFSHK